MLKNTKDLYGAKLAASDGDIGHVKDFYFDDKTWVARYMVADTGTWLSGRLVLLAPHSFGHFDKDHGVFHIKLTKAQIEGSPAIEEHRPVSRQYEVDYYRYYCWPEYWNGGAAWGPYAFPIAVAPRQPDIAEQFHPSPGDDKHLRSAKAVAGYAIQSADGPIGEVAGMMIDDGNWAVRDFVVNAGHWYSGKEIVIPTKFVEGISFEDSKVVVNLTKAEIRDTAEDAIAGSPSEAMGAAGFRD